MESASIQLARQDRQELAEDLAESLEDFGLMQIQAVGPGELRDRANALVTSFCEALARGDSTSFVTYIGGLTEERIKEGYYVDEMLDALDILEEEAWDRVAHEPCADTNIARLRSVTRTIGVAKDEIAKVYLSQKEYAEPDVERREAQIEELFKGTVSPPYYDEEDE